MRRFYLLGLLLICLLGIVACSDDGIYFTQDEVQGDIMTGKQIELKGNSLVVYTEGGSLVNVQGAKGQIHAVSSDEKVVTVSESTDGKLAVIVTSVSIGEGVVTVTDEEGNSAWFTVEVKDVEVLWTPKYIYVVSSDNKKCLVEGVNAADSVAIATDTLSKVREVKFVVKERPMIPFGVSKRLFAYDKEKNLLFRGYMYLEQQGNGLAQLSVYDRNQLLCSYQVNVALEFPSLIKDMTAVYQLAYPQVTKVQVYLPVRVLQ